MKSKVIKAVISGVVVLGIGFGGVYEYKANASKSTASTAAQYYAVSVRKMNLEVGVQGTGAAYSANTKDISPNNNGTLQSLNVKLGDTVTAGQKLFVSDSDSLRQAVTNAQNNLEKQNLSLSTDESAQKVDDNKIAMDNLSISDAKEQLSSAQTQLNNMTVTAPIGGVITALSNSNGDSIQSGKSVLTITDMSSIKVKVAIDELDIAKVQVGQKAAITFDGIKDKTFDGAVESIAPTGTSSNNVTTYDVVVNVNKPAGIKIGMNANVNIQVQSKSDALVIPAEALIERNGQKYVRIQSSNSTSANSTSSSGNNQTSSSNGQGQNRGAGVQRTTDSGTQIAVKTGMENENYIEITSGLKEGDKVLVQLPSTSSSNNNKNSNSNGFGGFGGNMGGGFGGNMGGNFGGNNSGSNSGSNRGTSSQGSSNNSSKN